MDDEAAKLKAELAELNAKCQLARDNEVRYALQRSRLETERAQLLVKLVEATTTAVPAAVLAAPYRVVLQMPAPENVPRPLPNPASLVDRRRKHKPDGLPSIAAMITATLKETPNLRPTEIADHPEAVVAGSADPHNQHNGVADGAFGTPDAAGWPLRAQWRRSPPERLMPQRVYRRGIGDVARAQPRRKFPSKQENRTVRRNESSSEGSAAAIRSHSAALSSQLSIPFVSDIRPSLCDHRRGVGIVPIDVEIGGAALLALSR